MLMFSRTLLGAKPSVVVDAANNVIRFGQTKRSAGQETTPQRNPSAKIAKSRLSKVPKPPNAFILYRQQKHRQLKAQNPSLANNTISQQVGHMWRNEHQSVRDTFIQLSLDAKRKHAQENPDYQYQPRKPSEKKRRVTKRCMEPCESAEKASEQKADFETVQQIGALTPTWGLARANEFLPVFENYKPNKCNTSATFQSGFSGTLDMMAEDYNSAAGLTAPGIHKDPTVNGMENPFVETGTADGNIQATEEKDSFHRIFTTEVSQDHQGYVVTDPFALDDLPMNLQPTPCMGPFYNAELQRQMDLEWEKLLNDESLMNDENFIQTMERTVAQHPRQTQR